MTVDSNIQPRALQPPNIPFNIRPVRTADLKALRQDCWKHHSLVHCREHLNMMNKAQENGRGLGIVVEVPDSEKLIAYGQYLRLAKCSEISDLIVSQAYRSQGIGTAMIQYLIASMPEPLTDCIEIGVAERNTGALRLYEHLGFTRGYEIMLNLGHGKEVVIYLSLRIN